MPGHDQPEAITPHTSPDGRSRAARVRRNKRHAKARDAAENRKPEPRITAVQVIARLLGYAPRCANTTCRRARRCTGEACVEQFWHHEDDAVKQACRTILTELAHGAPFERAYAAGLAVCDTWEAQQARWDAMAEKHRAQAVPQPPEPPPQPQQQDKATPRVRVL
jgi:hypothetical protein